ncbi:alpha/beta hydrolase [Kribbella sp. NPDC003557]|uniref:alpha/beta fold hydrolase n=1 Tax=Kribbella sp. NPDC003557 TaxID=3154449 RepID=UPI0033AF3FFC
MLPDVETLHSVVTGDVGDAILLVHGWGGDGRAWEPVRFAGRRVLTADLRGHGRSPVPAAGYRPADYAADLAALVRSSGLGPVVAVGHSMGGQIVVRLALDHPDLVRALVVVDPAYGADEVEAATFERRLAELRRDGAAAAVRQLGELTTGVREQLSRTPGQVLAASYAGMYTEPDAFGARPAAAEVLGRLTQPVLCIRPTRSMAAWDVTCDLPPGSRVVVWPGTGHFLHHDRPEAFVRLVDSWQQDLLVR